MVEIKVKMKDKQLDSLVSNEDWIDVRVSAITSVDAKMEDIHQLDRVRADLRSDRTLPLLAGSSIKVMHGICTKLPKGYEADLRPRGSLFKNTGLIFTSSGVIDEGFCGNGDEWFSTFYATKDCELAYNERICQFRIQRKQPKVELKEVKEMTDNNRGSHGSTGMF